MPISERMLRKWRGESLHYQEGILAKELPGVSTIGFRYGQLTSRVLKLTQELLDQALLRKEAGK